MAGVFKTLTFLVLVFAATTVFAEDYDVGGDAEWIRPNNPQFYTTWATGKTFRIGDELEFDFVAGRHDVAVVTKNAYDNCVKERPISLMSTPPVRIILNTTGPQYFICTIADHCQAGQKLAINVVGANGQSGGGATPAPGTTPGAGGASPTTPPGTTTPPGSNGTMTPPGSSGTTTPPAGNSASSLGGATFLAIFASVVVALF